MGTCLLGTSKHLCVIGVSIALLHMIFPSYIFLKPIAFNIYTSFCVRNMYSSFLNEDPRLNLADYKLELTTQVTIKRDVAGIYSKKSFSF